MVKQLMPLKRSFDIKKLFIKQDQNATELTWYGS